MLAIATWARAGCLGLTYPRPPGASPPRRVAGPGPWAAAVRAATRSVSSAGMAAAVPLPSRIVAGTADSLPERAPCDRPRPYPRRQRAPSPPADPRGEQMTERDQSPTGTQGGAGDWREQTSPGITPPGARQTDAEDPGHTRAPPYPGPQYPTTPVAARRPDTPARRLPP